MSTMLRGGQLARILGPWQGSRGVPDYAALAGAIRGLITDGRLALGVRLPAERELATALDISRTTVTAAYRQLRSGGHLASRRGAGSWTTLPSGARVNTAGFWSPDGPADMIDMSIGALPAPEQIATAASEAVVGLAGYTGSAGYHPAGLLELRAAVADRYAERGVPTSPEQVLITSGVQHALDLITRLLLGPGQSLLVETPTYPNALAGFVARRARVLTHGLGAEGWDADLLLASLRQEAPRLAYLVPEFHNPTGALMPVGLRERLPAAVHSGGTDLIIDESFVDLALDAEVPPPVAHFDRHARVLSIGGMSKPFWAGMRIGWVRAAAPLVQRLAALRVGVDLSSPVLDQLVAVRLLRHAPQVVRQRRALLRERRDALVAALRARLPEWRFAVPPGGMSLWVELDAPVSSALARAAHHSGVRLAPGPRFGVDGTLERFLRLPFTLPVPELIEAVTRIAAARAELDRPPSRRSYDLPTLVA